MYEVCLRGNMPDSAALLSRDDVVKLKRCIFAQGNLAFQIQSMIEILDLIYDMGYQINIFLFQNFSGAAGLPPITTHNVIDDGMDPVMNAFRR